MADIGIVELRDLPYQTGGISASRVYTFRGEEGLSLGRLLLGVCLERAMMLEETCVATMNKLAQNNAQIEAACAALEVLAAVDPLSSLNVTSTFITLPEGFPRRGSYGNRQPNLREYMETELGLSAPGGDSWDYKSRNAAYATIKNQLDALNSVSQETTIDLQTYITERNTAYNLATNGNKIILASKLNVAENYAY